LSAPHGFFEDTISLVELGADRGMVMVDVGVRVGVGVGDDDEIKMRKERRRRNREEAIEVLYFTIFYFFFLVMVLRESVKIRRVESFVVCIEWWFVYRGRNQKGRASVDGNQVRL
jgi:hypothetical protein